jgi:hybrid polyketide synthase/nonribosomal peptide synthetase ACE1
MVIPAWPLPRVQIYLLAQVSGFRKKYPAESVLTDLFSGPFVATSNLSMLSPHGRSRMWDADADGYARGDGIGAIALKKLSDAVKDGDHIECIIRGVGLNQDGRTKGITTPSPLAQEKLIRETYKRAGLDICNPRDRPQFFEAHGTGSPAGDPLEASAIRNTFFGPDYEPSEDEKLWVGSIKTIIGHAESAAGLAGILKASLALQHGAILPNLLFNKLNPAIEKYYQHLRIATEIQPWPALPEGVPRRVSVNSFGTCVLTLS